MVLLGPTASGKSQLAMTLAAVRPGTELVIVDSMQVYRGMDIGTAKPSPADQTLVPHHLIDLVHPGHDYTVNEFQSAYAACIADIEHRGARALIVAGTGLYLRAITDGLTMAGQYPEVRTQFEHQTTEALFDTLTGLDPIGAQRMEPTNRRRIERALEVSMGSGTPFSSFGLGFTKYPPSSMVQVGIRYERVVQANRVEARVHDMMNAGWLDEVTQLATAPIGRTAAQALGYRELLDHLRGRSSLDEAVGQTVIRTRQFAARQIRWFRRDPRINWHEIRADGNSIELLDDVLREYDRCINPGR